MKIRDLCPDERPREKLAERGAGALSNVELIAILLRTGTAGKNAVDTARMLLNASGGTLTETSRMTIEQMCRIDGIGYGKAVTIVAALELGKRLCSENPYGDRTAVHGASDIFRELRPEMHGLRHEECWVFYLTRSNRIICKERLSKGGQHETIVDIKFVVKRALDTLASAVILSHNHPSGDPRPGKADIELTKTLKRALATFDISFLDHVVVADGGYYSFAEENGLRAD